MYYTVYKISNLVNGKIYIGAHKTNNLDDGYMGSGKHLKRAQEKYGIENFTKEILEVFDSSEDMFNMESLLVNEEFVKNENTYNLKEGGYGGFDHLNSKRDDKYYQDKIKGAKATKIYYDNNPEASRMKTETLRSNTTFESASKGGKNSKGFTNKSHTIETKLKMSKARKGKVSGENNPSYGTIWIHSLTEKVSKKIKKDNFNDYENQGWLRGRKMKF